MSNTTNHPPKGDVKKAEHYISKLTHLLDTDRIMVVHTDLNNFEKGALQNHFRVDLKDYRIEISHSKDSSSLKDSYIMIFTNIGHLSAKLEGEAESHQSNQKVILAYLQLETQQYMRFHDSAISQLDRIRKIEEEQRFNQAVEPIDLLLDNPELIVQSEASVSPTQTTMAPQPDSVSNNTEANQNPWEDSDANKENSSPNPQQHPFYTPLS